jgi:hypothetical protein
MAHLRPCRSCHNTLRFQQQKEDRVSRHAFGQWQKRAPFWAMCSAALLVLLLAGNVWAAGSAREPMAGATKGGVTSEELTVPFVLGLDGLPTINSYSGRTQVKITGIGQAGGAAWSDAFYIFTDGEGNPVQPWHPTDWQPFGFTLCINSGPVDNFVDQIPRYNPHHVYVFNINAPGGLLRFGVGDWGIGDNTGEYQIVVRDLPH